VDEHAVHVGEPALDVLAHAHGSSLERGPPHPGVG
jgi:hypothetical protein